MTIEERLGAALGPNYVIERELGGGGMARLFVGSDATLGRRVVVKLLPDDVAEGIGLERFRREIQMLAQLQHPNIVPVLAAGDMDGQPFFTMPYVEGESLRVALKRDGALPTERAVSVLKDVAAALMYAHERGVVHRDIKPDNVLLSGSAAMVTDFGVAKVVADSGSQSASGILTSIGVVVGTPAYMAPEQAAGDRDVDHGADIYAFGAMAYELLTGSTLFGDRTPQSLLAAHISERPEHLLRKQSRVPPRLAALIMQCLDKSPDRRPQGAGEVLLRLSAGNLLERDIGAMLRRPVALAAAGGVLAATAILAYLAQQPTTNPLPDSAVAAIAMADDDPSQTLAGVSGPTSAYIARAKTLMDSARYGAARNILEMIVSPTWLQPVTVAERVQAYKYLGAIHSEQGREHEALLHYTAAVDFDPWVDLDPVRFTARQIELFHRARGRMAKYGIRPEDTLPRQRTTRHPFRLTQTQPARVTVTLNDYSDPGRSVTLYEGRSAAGERRLEWDGNLGGTPTGPGAYELRVRAVSDGGSTTETTVPFVLQHYVDRGTPMMRWSTPAPGDLRRTVAARQAGTDASSRDVRPDIALALRLYEQFNIEAAIPLLLAVVQRHEEYAREETARAFLYLGASYALLDKRDTARVLLRQALRNNPTLTLDSALFSPTEIAALDSARSAHVLAGLYPIEVAAAFAGERFRYFSAYASRQSNVAVTLRREGQSERHVIFETEAQGTAPVVWNGMIGGSPVPEGRYEVMVLARTADGQRDSTSAHFSVRYEIVAGSGRQGLTLLVVPSP